MAYPQVVYEKVYSSKAKFVDGRSVEEWLKIAEAISLLRKTLPEECPELEDMLTEHLEPRIRVILDNGQSFTLKTVLVGMSSDDARMHLRGRMTGMTNVRRVFGRKAEYARDGWDAEFVVSVRYVGGQVHCAVAFLSDRSQEIDEVFATRREDIVGWPSH